MKKFTILIGISVVFSQVCSQTSFTRCNADLDCKYPNSQCDHTTNYCECKEGFQMLLRNNTYYFCSTDKKYYEQCTDDSECINLLGAESMCYKEKCLCRDGTHLVRQTGKCYRTSLLDESCYNEYNCPLDTGDFARCIGSTCKCPHDRIATKNRRLCMPKMKLKEKCAMNEQCSGTLNAICRTTCECDKGFVLSSNGTLCLEEAIEFGSACIEINQCTKYLKGSVCKNRICDCPPGKHPKNGNCEGNKALGEECTTSESCLTRFNNEELSGIVVCENKVCKHLRSADFSQTINKLVLFVCVFLFPLMK